MQHMQHMQGPLHMLLAVAYACWLWDLNTKLPQHECKLRVGYQAAHVAQAGSSSQLLAAPHSGCGTSTRSCLIKCSTLWFWFWHQPNLAGMLAPPLQGHRNWVLCVAWSPDASMIATGDMNGDIWLWEAASGKPLGQCKGHSKWITSLVRRADLLLLKSNIIQIHELHLTAVAIWLVARIITACEQLRALL
jgi:WD40 repeat protein